MSGSAAHAGRHGVSDSAELQLLISRCFSIRLLLPPNTEQLLPSIILDPMSGLVAKKIFDLTGLVAVVTGGGTGTTSSWIKC